MAAEIRIGITGDYPPMSLYNEVAKAYQGFDIDMAYSLGSFLAKKVVFSKTSWPTLAQDLQTGQFDIAMGGIGITAERSQQFLFSKAILTDEKVAVFHEVDRLKFQQFSDMNQPQVTIIENPGGTNERFVRQHLPNAKLIIFPDNKQIFTQLLHKAADVMITDAIEAYYQQKLQPQLSILQFPEETHYEYKAYMLRQEDEDLLAVVNVWLDTITTNKTLALIKEKWGVNN